MTVDIAHLNKLIDAFEASDWDDVHLRGDGYEIRLSTRALERGPSAAPTPVPVVESAPARLAPTGENKAGPLPVEIAPGTHVVSPTMGIFWQAPSPTSPPFVAVGDAVAAEDILCIVEVMKLMTQVQAGFAGRVVQVLVENGQAVELGQPLFVVQPR